MNWDVKLNCKAEEIMFTGLIKTLISLWVPLTLFDGNYPNHTPTVCI
jgi:hypothetical protein